MSVALPVAYWLRYRGGRLAMPCLFIITASMFASYLVRIYAWRTILGANGVFNQGARSLGVIEEPLGFLLYNWFSVTSRWSTSSCPMSCSCSTRAFARFAGAPGSRAGPWAPTARKLAARDPAADRCARPRTSFLFVFILSASDYVTPQLIGGTGGQMLGVQIQANFKAIGDWPQGAALSVLMLLALHALLRR